ncbi:phosphatase PAP2 family protein [Mucilaginibacter agri]|uniref:Phosphatase PAP2 family protein n=1 Tax=Mucilaginibacter agri TaxID=2695265 RepID=A0A965ZHC5_9SPHI|nr:phosphatase PAP2 family protein [Mucilaginibacter agri]NCD71025.1 phosphatase PAP2 family protein [Mucilaginibacter agri]
MKKVIFILLCFICLKATAQKADTTKKVNVGDTLKKDLFTAPDTVQHLRSKTWALIPPAVLVGYGISSFYIKPVRQVDKYIYDQTAKNNFVPSKHIENFFQYTPVVLTYGLNLVGVHGKNTFVDRTLIYLLSQGMLELTVFSLKHATHRTRPDGSDNYSFPSGHTANAFNGAEFMSQELSGNSVAYGIIGYTFATTTGVFRIYHQDHWFSDVVAGAGFGILSTKAAYLLYPVIRNRLTRSGREKEKNKDVPPELQKQKPQKNTWLLPSFREGTLGLQFAMTL